MSLREEIKKKLVEHCNNEKSYCGNFSYCYDCKREFYINLIIKERQAKEELLKEMKIIQEELNDMCLSMNRFTIRRDKQ